MNLSLNEAIDMAQNCPLIVVHARNEWMNNMLAVYVFQVSVIVDKTALMLYMLYDVEHPVVLNFHEEYGHIVTYQWSVRFCDWMLLNLLLPCQFQYMFFST